MPSTTASPTAPPPSGPIGGLIGAFNRLKAELAKFGTIGLAAFVVDFFGFNLLVVAWFWDAGGTGPLRHHTFTASCVSTAAGMVVSWFGNKLWTYRHRPPENPRQAAVLFVVFNIVGLLITAACVAFSTDVLHLHDILWLDFFRFLGIGLGTIFRFLTYRKWVFPESDLPSAIEA